MILNKKALAYGINPGYDKKTIIVEQTSTIKLNDYYTGKDLQVSLIVKTGATATIDFGISPQRTLVKIENLGDEGYEGSVSAKDYTLTTGKYVTFFNIFDDYLAVAGNLE